MLTKTRLYNFSSFLQQDLKNGAFSFNQLLNGEVHGFIVKDFLNENEMASILVGFRNLENEVLHLIPGFDSYPMGFAQLDQLAKHDSAVEKKYFDASNNYINTFASHFGVDIFAKLDSIFKNINNSPEVKLLPNGSGGGYFAPFNFRELFEGEVCLKAHCENMLMQEFSGFFERIKHLVTTDNQLSFFIVVQQPGQGGELTLYETLWKEGQQRHSDDELKLEDGSIHHLDDEEALKRDYIKPPQGSLVVFSGGNIWHRIEKIVQAPSRITLGGFLSLSHDGSKLYCWS